MYFGRKGFAVVFIVYGHQGGDKGENHEEDHHDGIGDLKKGKCQETKIWKKKDKFENQLALIKNREDYVCDRSKGNLDVTRWTSDWREANALLYTP